MPAEPEPPKFTPFVGTAKRLVRAHPLVAVSAFLPWLSTQRHNVADTTLGSQDGKTVVLPPPVAAAGAPGGAPSGAGTKDGGAAAPAPKSTAGKLVFGGAKPSAPAAAPAKAAPSPEARADPKGEEPKFTPFTGTGRKLK